MPPLEALTRDQIEALRDSLASTALPLEDAQARLAG